MSVTLNSNIASLKTQSGLRKAGDSLAKSFERLSSGLRINRASDDPAGLAVSEKLNTFARLSAQAYRNVNDSISFLSVAESAVSELSELLTRLRELSIQSQNGALSRVQRLALDEESEALTSEYNRIVSSTEFNGQTLLDGGIENLAVQIGITSNGSVSFDIAQEFTRTVGDGTYQNVLSSAIGATNPVGMASADFNGDGVLDVVTNRSGSGPLRINFGNGDGTFGSTLSLSIGDSSRALEVADIDGDGDMDIISDSAVTDKIYVFENDGTGAFASAVTYDVGRVATIEGGLAMSDVDGDGDVDILSMNDQSTLHVLLNNGNGSFQTIITNALNASEGYRELDVGDFNQDGFLDLAIAAATNETIQIVLGNGDGTFGNQYAYTDVGLNPSDIEVADLNHDGIQDLITVSGNDNSLSVILGNSDGTFQAAVSYSVGNGPGMFRVGDLNGDGELDIALAATSSDHLQVLIGAGDGTFSLSGVSYALSGTVSTTNEGLEIGDFDNDGAADVIVLGQTNATIDALLGNSQTVGTIPRLDLTTVETAREALSVIDATISRVTSELGDLGSAMSRLEYSSRVVAASRESYAAAASQITDADIAAETAELVRNQILQQAATAILAQANRSPEIALALLQ